MDFFRRLQRGSKEPEENKNAKPNETPLSASGKVTEAAAESDSDLIDPAPTVPLAETLPMMGVTRPLPSEPSVILYTGHLSYGQISDQGVVRQNNQDAALSFTFSSDTVETRPDFGIFVVADGMGGHQDGEKASAITARVVVSEVLKKIYLPMMEDSVLQHDADRPTIAEILTEAVKQANARVLELIADAGTTLTALVVIGRLAHVAHVGDSRAYLIYKDEIEQMTRDHSLVQRLVELNQLTVEDSHNHPQRNVLYRAVGLNDMIEVDILTRRLYPGSYVLLCSDGLWGFVSEHDILQVIKSTPDPQEACHRLVDIANERGGSDNITVILLKIPEK